MNCDKTVQIHVSGNFPKTAWRAFKTARRLIPCLFVSKF